jgi:hypothetical protein
MAGSIKIYVDLSGKDHVPHVFIGITNSAGVTTYAGYAPASHGTPIGKGQVYQGVGDPDPKKDAGSMQEVAYASGSIQITDAQVTKLTNDIAAVKLDPGTYVGAFPFATNNCATFVKTLLSDAGITYPYSSSVDQPSSFLPSNQLNNFYSNGSLTDKAIHPENYPDTPASQFIKGGGPATAPVNDIIGYIEDTANNQITVTHQDGSVDVITYDGNGTQTATTTRLDGLTTVVTETFSATFRMTSETVTTTNAAGTQITTTLDSNADGTIDKTTTTLDADHNGIAERTTVAITGGDTTVAVDANQNGRAESVTTTHANQEKDLVQTDEAALAWASISTHYDAQGRADTQRVDNHDGSFIWNDWDRPAANQAVMRIRA